MFRHVLLVCALGGVASAESLSLTEALQRATTRPTIAIATAERDAARGNAADLPLYNPTLELAAGPRWSSGETLTGASVGIGQTLELGGKRAARRDAAAARARAAELGLAGSLAAARIETWRSYELAIVARLRVDAARAAEDTASVVAAATQQSQSLGGETQLRLNLASSELGKAKHDRIDAENTYAAALAELASMIGAPAGAALELSAVAPALPVAPKEASLVGDALGRPELAQARAELDAAHAEVRGADAGAVPDVTLSVTYGYEPDPDRRMQSVTLGAQVALPVRTRNQGQRAATRALARRAQVEADWLRTEIERTARVSVQRYARALTAMEAFGAEVTDKLQDNLQLATDSYRAGKIDFYAFSLVRRELFANRLGYLDAVSEAIEAWAAVARAAGRLEVTP